jgi:hypothetical protein
VGGLVVDRLSSPKTAGVTSTFVVNSATAVRAFTMKRRGDLVATNDGVLGNCDRSSIFKGPLEVAAAEAISYLTNLDEGPVGATADAAALRT